MFMKRFLSTHGYHAPAGDDGATAGGGAATDPVVDRGDEVIVSPLADVKTDDKKGDEKDKLSDEDETDDEKAEREREEKRARARIPKARFDEAQNKARAREQALQAQIDELKGATSRTAVQRSVAEMRDKIDDLEDKYEDLITEGKKEDARKVRKEARQLRDELSDFQTSTKTEAARREAVEELTFNSELASIEGKFPTLNPDHADFDEAQADEVADLLKVFIKGGEPRAKALRRAVKYVLGTSPDAPATAAKDDAAATKAKRDEDARRKAADANKRQPTNTSGVGLDSTRGGKATDGVVDVMKMKQDEFNKMDDEQKARLRGDIL